MTSPLSEPITRAVTFGEAMIRVTPPFHERLESSSTWTPTVGGTELNVAAGLRILGVRSAWVFLRSPASITTTVSGGGVLKSAVTAGATL